MRRNPVSSGSKYLLTPTSFDFDVKREDPRYACIGRGETCSQFRRSVSVQSKSHSAEIKLGCLASDPNWVTVRIRLQHVMRYY